MRRKAHGLSMDGSFIQRFSRRNNKTMGQIHRVNSSNSTEMPEYSYVAQEDDYRASTTPRTNIFNDANSPIMVKDKMNNWQRKYTLFLYSITTVLLFADQNLLAPNLSAAAEEFGFENDERDKRLGGDIALAFFLLGAPASFKCSV